MSYATPADLEVRLGKAFSALYRDNAAAPTDDLAQASAEIDAYLGSRYAVPVTAPGSQLLLEEWTLTLAEEKAYARSGGGSAIPEKVTRRVDSVRKALRDAAAGLMRLPGAVEAGATGAGGTGALVIEMDTPVFTRRKMRGY